MVLTLLAQSNLANLGGIVAPHPVSNTGSDSHRDCDSEEKGDSRWLVFLVEFLFVTLARMRDALVELSTTGTS
jgi:hypothetical protein